MSRFCFYIDEDTVNKNGDFVIMKVTENVAGYLPVGSQKKDYQELLADIDLKNAELGLSNEDVRDIITSSMAAQGWDI